MDKMLRRLIGEDIDLVTVRKKGLGQVKADPDQADCAQFGPSMRVTQVAKA